MTESLKHRTVEVFQADSKGFGTGCLIAPGTVLTAAHIFFEDGGPIRIRTLVDGAVAEAHVLWRDTRLDALLLACGHEVGAGLPVLRLGEIVCHDPEFPALCHLVGFPHAMRRGVPGLRQLVSDPKVVSGNITPTTASRSQNYGLEITGSWVSRHSGWKGMSGAGVFRNGILIGLATLAPDDMRGSMILITPMARLLAAQGFRRAVAEATGSAQQLQPADLHRLFTNTPEPHLASSYLLAARSRVVPHSGMAEQMQSLNSWCSSNTLIEVAALTGAGGTGKTRLVAELLEQLINPPAGPEMPRAWTGGYLDDGPGDQLLPYAMLASVGRPLLIIVDYAEARLEQIGRLLAVLADRHTGEKIRILLLARAHDRWWPRFGRAWEGSGVLGAGLTVEVGADDAWGKHDRAAAFNTAVQAFETQLKLLHDADVDGASPPRSAPPPEEAPAFAPAPGEPIIGVHIAALAQALARSDAAYAHCASPSEVVLDHEEGYWQRVAHARGLDALLKRQPDLLRSLVATQLLTGAADRTEARSAIAAGYEVHHHGLPPGGPPEELAALEEILADLYPSGGSARWGRLGPDSLAAELLATVDKDSDQEFVAELLPHPKLTADQRQQSLISIARASSSQPQLNKGAAHAVTSAPEVLLPLATETVPDQLPPAAARGWLQELKDTFAAAADELGSDAAATIRASEEVERALQRLDTPPEHLPPLPRPAPPPAPRRAERPTRRLVLHASQDASGRFLRALLTITSLTYLVIVSYVAIDVYYLSPTDIEGAPTWSVPPFIIVGHFLVGWSLHPATLVPRRHSWPLAIMLAILTIGTGTEMSRDNEAGASQIMLWFIWTVLLLPGMGMYVLALRTWFTAADTPSRR